MLHTADFAGAAKPFPVARTWSEKVNREFCDQYNDEIEGVFDFCCHVLDAYGFDYSVGLKTRGEKRIGSDEIWDMADNTAFSASMSCGGTRPADSTIPSLTTPPHPKPIALTPNCSESKVGKREHTIRSRPGRAEVRSRAKRLCAVG